MLLWILQVVNFASWFGVLGLIGGVLLVPGIILFPAIYLVMEGELPRTYVVLWIINLLSGVFGRRVRLGRR
jgi:hypothetical protein